MKVGAGATLVRGDADSGRDHSTVRRQRSTTQTIKKRRMRVTALATRLELGTTYSIRSAANALSARRFIHKHKNSQIGFVSIIYKFMETGE